jgi:hypothetical protein
VLVRGCNSYGVHRYRYTRHLLEREGRCKCLITGRCLDLDSIHHQSAGIAGKFIHFSETKTAITVVIVMNDMAQHALVQRKNFTIVGIRTGFRMIASNMGVMLFFVHTNVGISIKRLCDVLKIATQWNLNCMIMDDYENNPLFLHSALKIIMTGNREEKAALVFFGVIRESNSKFLEICLGARHIPIISSLVIDWKGNDLNIRADAMIEKIETILDIFKLIPLASVGILMDKGRHVCSVD